MLHPKTNLDPGGFSIENLSKYSSHETIAEIFRMLGLDDPELRRRLQDFSNPEVWPRQVKKSDVVLITRSNTAPEEGGDNLLQSEKSPNP